jgi:phospholipase/carboxylesterase
VTEPARFDNPPPVIVETGASPIATIIWMHGLGADGHDFEPIVPELQWPDARPLRFVFPHAPYRPVTINGGYEMRAWYDIAMDVHGFRQDEAQIRESAGYVADLVARERAAGRDSRRIVLAGFSQGAAMALHTGLRYPEPLAGIMALSMPIPLPEKIAPELHAANAGVPVFLAHGTSDAVVPFARGEFARQLLQQLALPVEWHRYNMPHTVCGEEVADTRAWLLRVLGE